MQILQKASFQIYGNACKSVEMCTSCWNEEAAISFSKFAWPLQKLILAIPASGSKCLCITFLNNLQSGPLKHLFWGISRIYTLWSTLEITLESPYIWSAREHKRSSCLLLKAVNIFPFGHRFPVKILSKIYAMSSLEFFIGPKIKNGKSLTAAFAIPKLVQICPFHDTFFFFLPWREKLSGSWPVYMKPKLSWTFVYAKLGPLCINTLDTLL